jgi:hypothetical protein
MIHTAGRLIMKGSARWQRRSVSLMYKYLNEAGNAYTVFLKPENTVVNKI